MGRLAVSIPYDSSSSVERVDSSHRPEVAWREVGFDEHHLADVRFPAMLGASSFVGPGGLGPQNDEVFTGEASPEVVEEPLLLIPSLPEEFDRILWAKLRIVAEVHFGIHLQRGVRRDEVDGPQGKETVGLR
jgi:hypothetical protein